MEIANINYGQGNPSFGYNLKLHDNSNIQFFIRNTAERLFKEDKAEHQRYLKALQDFKNKRFDGTELKIFYLNQIKQYDESFCSKWLEFCNKLASPKAEKTEKQNTKKQKIGEKCRNFLKKIVMSINPTNYCVKKREADKIKKNDADMSNLNVDVTGYNSGIDKAITIHINGHDWWNFRIQNTYPEFYLRDVFTNTDKIYEFMNEIDSAVKNRIKDKGNDIVNDAKYSVQRQVEQRQQLEFEMNSLEMIQFIEDMEKP